MKLHQTILKEMTGPIPMEVIMQEIIDKGGIDNRVQLHMLAVLTEYFRDAPAPTLAVFDGLPTLDSKATSDEVVDFITDMPSGDQVKLAELMQSWLKKGAEMISNPGITNGQDWINFVLQKQGK